MLETLLKKEKVDNLVKVVNLSADGHTAMYKDKEFIYVLRRYGADEYKVEAKWRRINQNENR